MKIDPEFVALRQSILALDPSTLAPGSVLLRIVENERSIFDVESKGDALEIIDISRSLPELDPELGIPLARAMLHALSRAEWNGTIALSSVEVVPTPFNAGMDLELAVGCLDEVVETPSALPKGRLPAPLVAIMPNAYDIVGLLSVCKVGDAFPIVYLSPEIASSYLKGEGKWWALAGRGRWGMLAFRFLHALRVTPRFDGTASLMRQMGDRLDDEAKAILDWLIPDWTGA